jgi:RNA polymerase sigma-70 factor (ECF subfamily)
VPLAETDLACVEAVRRGSADAFREIVDRHGDVVYSVLVRLTGSPDLSDELAQETFVRAYEKLGTFRAEAGLRTWLVQIAINLVRDRRRAAGRSPKIVSLDELRQRSQGDSEPREFHPRTEPVHGITQRELAARLERELTRLPLEYREAFVLKHIEGLSYEEISKITGLSIGCLKVRVHRSRAKLRDALSDVGKKGRGHGRSVGTLPGR